MSFSRLPSRISPWKAFFCLLFLFLPLLVFSQSNYKPGLVVTSQGDTLKGLINYREWNSNPGEFSFKSADNQLRPFTPRTARYVAIEGFEVYEAHQVKISQDEVASSRLKEGLDTTTISATVFLKLLLKGDQVNLYSYKDKLKERFYFWEKGAAAPVELGYKVYLEHAGIATSAVYKQQLASLAVRHQVFTLTQQIQSADYTRPHLMRIIGKINGTTDRSISKMLEQAPSIRWFGSAGFNLATFIFEGENELMIDKISDNGFYLFKDQITTRSYLPRFSTGMDIYLNPAVQRFVFRGELTLAPASSEVRTHFLHKNYSDTRPPHEQLNTYRLFLLTISAAPQLLVNAYNTENLKLYLGAGSALNYRLATQNKMHLKRTDQDVTVAEGEKDNFYEMRKLGLTVLARSGIILNRKFDLSVLYTPLARINYWSTDTHEASTISTSSLQVSGGYFF